MIFKKLFQLFKMNGAVENGLSVCDLDTNVVGELQFSTKAISLIIL